MGRRDDAGDSRPGAGIGAESAAGKLGHDSETSLRVGLWGKGGLGRPASRTVPGDADGIAGTMTSGRALAAAVVIVGAAAHRDRSGVGHCLAVLALVAVARHGERHDPRARRHERAGAVAARHPRDVDVRGAAAVAGPWRAVARVAVVADPLDRRLERTGGAGPRAPPAPRPAPGAGGAA